MTRNRSVRSSRYSRSGGLLLAVAATLIAVLKTSGPSSAVERPRPVVYCYNDAVWIKNADGSGRRVLARAKGWQFSEPPSLSPDGKKVVYSGSFGDPGSARTILFIVGINGQGRRSIAQVERYGYFRTPVFLPDGKSVAFTEDEDDGGSSSLHFIDLSSGRDRLVYPRLKGSYYDVYQPVPSPDGRTIAVASQGIYPYREGTTENGLGLVVIDIATSKARFVCKTTETPTILGWEKDGVHVRIKVVQYINGKAVGRVMRVNAVTGKAPNSDR